MIEYLNQNTGAVTGLATLALLVVTGWYAWTTRALLLETKTARLLSNQPRIVAYLRVHEVQTGIVQLCVANLSGAAAVDVSVSVVRTTEWPDPFDLQDSKILRDLSVLRPHEVLKFDLGMGPDLFRNDVPAKFNANVVYASLDGRAFSAEHELAVESVEGFSHWQIYGVDDVARRLKDISDTLKGLTGSHRIKIETYDAQDRANERKRREEERAHYRDRQNHDFSNARDGEKAG